MKNFILLVLLLILPFCVGCSSLFSGADFAPLPVMSKKFHHLIGKKYQVIAPLVIIRPRASWGPYLTVPGVDGKKVADVPAGSIIIIDHVTMSYNIVLGNSYNYIARFEDKNIFRGKFNILYINEGSDNGPFVESKYLKAIE